MNAVVGGAGGTAWMVVVLFDLIFWSAGASSDMHPATGPELPISGRFPVMAPVMAETPAEGAPIGWSSCFQSTHS